MTQISEENRSDLPEELVQDVDEELETIPVTYSITAYGADYPVDSLVKRLEAGDIVIPQFSWEPQPGGIVGFQRDYVWPRPKADRFVESLLLGLPVPGIFLVKEESERFLVLDGHQRLYTLQSFYGGVIHGLEYRLEYVQPRFQRKNYRDLDVEDRRRLDDSIIHATIVRQDEPSDDQSSIYAIFERLNTGGVNLQPQEVRVALYHGPLVGVLRRLNDYSSWRKLYGKKSKRLKDIEMVLRFLSFFYYSEKYRSPMKDFLNRYMAANQHLQFQSEEELTSLFHSTCELILAAIGPLAFKPYGAVNAAVVDSVMTGTARRISTRPVSDQQAFAKAYRALLKTHEYLEATTTGTSQEANVKARLSQATEAFADVM